MAISLPTRATAQKARHLPVKLAGPLAYIVGSGSEPGVVYRVESVDGEVWRCDCVSPGPCSHIWAALAFRTPAVRLAVRRIAAGKPVAVAVTP